MRPHGGADPSGDLVQPPVKLPVVAEVVLAVKPLAWLECERLERGRPGPLAALDRPAGERKAPQVLVVAEGNGGAQDA